MQAILLLNNAYLPIGTISWRKAVGLVLGREKAEVVVEYGSIYSNAFNAAVIRLVVSCPDPFVILQKQTFSKKRVLTRDRFECQYCEVPLTMAEGTIDHIVPRSKGGETSYLNCVASCRPCNTRKDNKSLEQANMKLKNKPRYPTVGDFFAFKNTPAEWEPFISFLKK